MTFTDWICKLASVCCGKIAEVASGFRRRRRQAEMMRNMEKIRFLHQNLAKKQIDFPFFAVKTSTLESRSRKCNHQSLLCLDKLALEVSLLRVAQFICAAKTNSRLQKAAEQCAFCSNCHTKATLASLSLVSATSRVANSSLFKWPRMPPKASFGPN